VTTLGTAASPPAGRPERGGGSGPASSGPSGPSGPAGSAEASDPAAPVPLLARPLASYYLVLFSAGLLLLLGLVMVLSASSVRSYEDFGSSYVVFIRQATWVAIGLPLLAVASRVPPRYFRGLAYPVLALALLLLAVVLVPPFGSSVNGARRWIALGPFSIQPSELAKLGLLLWGSDLFVRKQRLLTDWKHLLVPLVPVTIFISLLIMMEPDMGTTIVIVSILLTLLWVVGTPMAVFGSLVALIVASGAVMAITEPYRMERLLSFRNPWKDASGTGYQAVQGLYALGSGGWWGEGLGASREKWPDLLPHAHTDFILAIIGEELGLLGSLVVVSLFATLGYAGIRVAHRSRDPFAQLAAAGISGWIICQAVVNMGAVIGLVPITGIPLPLVSFGGSALLPTMVVVGMLLSFARAEPAAERLLARRAADRRAAGRFRAARRAAARRGRGAAARGARRVATRAGEDPRLEAARRIGERARERGMV